MPNWVENVVTIAGIPEEIARVKAHLSRPHERKFVEYTEEGKVTAFQTVNKEFSLWNIVSPKGDALDAYNESIGASATFPLWYGWNIQNWGTKWDVDIEDTNHSEDHLEYIFNTAWDAPHAALRALSKQFPSLHIDNHFEEEQGWGGEYLYTPSGITIVSEWDIPQSHADYNSRGRDCICSWAEERDSWFGDCPNKREASA